MFVYKSLITNSNGSCDYQGSNQLQPTLPTKSCISYSQVWAIMEKSKLLFGLEAVGQQDNLQL